jgi:hypothetical protein
MPTIKLRQQQLLLPEGEYAGQARRVSQEWSKPKPGPDGRTPEPVMIFRVPLWTPTGKSVTAYLRAKDSCSWVWENACKSGEMIPEGEEVRFTPDDFENRKFFFGIEHGEYMGVPKMEVKFHSKAYAVQVNPALEHVTFPNEAPRPIYLKAVTPPGSTPAAEPPQKSEDAALREADSVLPPSPQSSAPRPPVSQPSSPGSSLQDIPSDDPAMDGITEDEFREALAYAKRLAAEKQNPPKDKAA